MTTYGLLAFRAANHYLPVELFHWKIERAVCVTKPYIAGGFQYLLVCYTEFMYP